MFDWYNFSDECYVYLDDVLWDTDNVQVRFNKGKCFALVAPVPLWSCSAEYRMVAAQLRKVG